MSIDEQIAKLEALLTRVRSRAREPGEGRYVPPAPAANGVIHEEAGGAVVTTAAKVSDRPAPRPQAPPTFSPLEVPTPMAGFRPSPVPPAPSPQPASRSEPPQPPSAPRIALRPEAPAFFLTPQAPTVQATTAAKPPLPRPEASRVRPVEPPPMEVVELEVDPDPSIPPSSLKPLSSMSGPASGEPLESRSRLVSAPPASPDDVELEPEAYPGSRASDPTIEVAAAEVSRTELEALEEIEESERAPTSSRRPISLEEKMSEPDDPPLHAPPPESGKVPAASPAIDVGFDEAREPAPAPVRESIRMVQAHVEVASFVGETPTSSSPSFGDLLDAALSL